MMDGNTIHSAEAENIFHYFLHFQEYELSFLNLSF